MIGVLSRQLGRTNGRESLRLAENEKRVTNTGPIDPRKSPQGLGLLGNGQNPDTFSSISSVL